MGLSISPFSTTTISTNFNFTTSTNVGICSPGCCLPVFAFGMVVEWRARLVQCVAGRTKSAKNREAGIPATILSQIQDSLSPSQTILDWRLRNSARSRITSRLLLGSAHSQSKRHPKYKILFGSVFKTRLSVRLVEEEFFYRRFAHTFPPSRTL